MVTRKLKLIFLGVVLLWIPFVTRVAGKYFHSDIHDNCIKYLISLVLQSLITAFDTAWLILLVQQTLTEILLRKRTQRAVVNFSGRFTIIMRATSSNFNRFQGTNSPQCWLVENTMLSPQLETGEKLFIRKQVANVYLIQETSWKKNHRLTTKKTLQAFIPFPVWLRQALKQVLHALIGLRPMYYEIHNTNMTWIWSAVVS